MWPTPRVTCAYTVLTRANKLETAMCLFIMDLDVLYTCIYFYRWRFLIFVKKWPGPHGSLSLSLSLSLSPGSVSVALFFSLEDKN